MEQSSGQAQGVKISAKRPDGRLQQSSEQFPRPEGSLDNDFRLSAHVADLDDLLGKPPTYDYSDTLTKKKAVAWPPPSNRHQDSPHLKKQEPLEEQAQYAPTKVMQTPPPSSYAKKHTTPASKMTFGQDSSSNPFSAQELSQIDREIADIQNRFDSDVDTLYRTKERPHQRRQPDFKGKTRLGARPQVRS